ncbi:MFS transporter [Bacillus sp. BGMRC 2118]|nr:MFS transporter [Bacillus sp. BGMRC 2118]
MKKRIINKSILISITFLTLLLIIPLLIQNLIEEQNLHMPGWSRSVDLGEQAINKSTFQRKNKDSIDIYITNSKASIMKVEIDPLTLKVMKDKEINVPSNPYYTYWVSNDDQHIIYLLRETLYHYHDGENEMIAEDVDELTVNDRTIIFRSDQSVYSLDTSNFSKTEILNDDKLLKVVVDPYSPSFISLHQYGELGGVEFTYHKWDGQKYESTSVYRKGSFTHPVTNIDFKEWNQSLMLIYETTVISGGGKEISHYYIDSPLTSEQQEISETKLKVVEGNHMELSSVQELQFINSDKELAIVLRANGELKKSMQNRNLYIASLHNGKWNASRISTNYDPIVEPLVTEEDYITWFIHDGSKYRLSAANTSRQVINVSKESTVEDWSRALEDTLFSLTSALVMMLFSILLVVPAIIVIFISKFFDVKNTTKVEWIANGLFALCSYALVNKVLSEKFLSTAPAYLTFQGSIWVIIGGVLGGSYLLTRLTRNRDWEFEMDVFYFIGVSIWVFSLLIGPYII